MAGAAAGVDEAFGALPLEDEAFEVLPLVDEDLVEVAVRRLPAVGAGVAFWMVVVVRAAVLTVFATEASVLATTVAAAASLEILLRNVPEIWAASAVCTGA